MTSHSENCEETSDEFTMWRSARFFRALRLLRLLRLLRVTKLQQEAPVVRRVPSE